MTDRTALNFMQVAETFSGKSEMISDLPPTALYALAAPSTPDAVREAAEELVVEGQRLIEQKASLPHGAFLPWIEAEFGMSQRTAYRFIDVAKTFDGRVATVASFDLKALYALAAPSTPDAVREAAETFGGESATVAHLSVRAL